MPTAASPPPWPVTTMAPSSRTRPTTNETTALPNCEPSTHPQPGVDRGLGGDHGAADERQERVQETCHGDPPGGDRVTLRAAAPRGPGGVGERVRRPPDDHPSLAPDALLAAYAHGYFPMDSPGATGPVALFEADPRSVIPIDAFRTPRSVRRGVARGGLRGARGHGLRRRRARLRRAPRWRVAHAAAGAGLRRAPPRRLGAQRRDLARRRACAAACSGWPWGPVQLRRRCSTGRPTPATRRWWRRPGSWRAPASRCGTSRPPPSTPSASGRSRSRPPSTGAGWPTRCGRPRRRLGGSP